MTETQVAIGHGPSPIVPGCRGLDCRLENFIAMAQTVSPTSVSTVSTQTFDVELRQVSKVFEGAPAVDAIDLQIKQGEFFSILGPSGCGKTTTLRLIAGFEQPTQGAVLIQGRRMEWVPPYQRSVNTVFPELCPV
jgi:spermidine/putrescine transport system ATP-binding protein